MAESISTAGLGFSFLDELTDFFIGLCPIGYPCVVAKSASFAEVFLDKDSPVVEVRFLDNQSWSVIVDKYLVDQIIAQTVILGLLLATDKSFSFSPMEVISPDQDGYLVIVQ